MNSRLFALFCLIGLLLALPAQSRMVLEIHGGSNKPWRIAVVPFVWQTDRLRILDPARIVEQDLVRYSGFDLVQREQMLSFPEREDALVRWDWLSIGADFVLMAQVGESPEGRLKIDWVLYDVSRGKTVMSATEHDNSEGLRRMLHRISDRVHFYVLGVPGINSARFVYVSAASEYSDRALYRLVQADADGLRKKILFSANDPILAPAWAPDGRRIAFATFAGGQLRIRILDLATGRIKYLASWGGNASEPAFSPNGEYLAITLSRQTNPDIYIYHLKSGRLTRLTSHFAIDAEPVWMPDGSSILFTSDRSGTAQIYRSNLLTGEVTRLTFSAGNDGRARVFPDGRWVAFVRSLGEASRIALLDLETLSVRPLTGPGLNDSPSVSPDGNSLIYSSSAGRGGGFNGIRIRDNGTFKLQNLGVGVRSPAWSPPYK